MGVGQPAFGDQVATHQEEHPHADLMDGVAADQRGKGPCDIPHMADKDEDGGCEADDGEVVLPAGWDGCCILQFRSLLSWLSA